MRRDADRPQDVRRDVINALRDGATVVGSRDDEVIKAKGRIVCALVACIALVACADASSSGGEANGSSPSSPSGEQPEWADLKCPPTTASEGYISEIAPTAEGEADPIGALTKYFAFREFDVDASEFQIVAEADGLAQAGNGKGEDLTALAFIEQVDSGGWVVSEFTFCKEFKDEL